MFLKVCVSGFAVGFLTMKPGEFVLNFDFYKCWGNRLMSVPVYPAL